MLILPRKLAKWTVAVRIVECIQAQSKALASLRGNKPTRGFQCQILYSLISSCGGGREGGCWVECRTISLIASFPLVLAIIIAVLCLEDSRYPYSRCYMSVHRRAAVCGRANDLLCPITGENTVSYAYLKSVFLLATVRIKT